MLVALSLALKVARDDSCNGALVGGRAEPLLDAEEEINSTSLPVF